MTSAHSVGCGVPTNSSVNDVVPCLGHPAMNHWHHQVVTVGGVEPTCSTVSVDGATGRRENPLNHRRRRRRVPIKVSELKVGTRYFMYRHNTIPHEVTALQPHQSGDIKVTVKWEVSPLKQTHLLHPGTNIGWVDHEAYSLFTWNLATTPEEMHL